MHRLYRYSTIVHYSKNQVYCSDPVQEKKKFSNNKIQMLQVNMYENEKKL